MITPQCTILTLFIFRKNIQICNVNTECLILLFCFAAFSFIPKCDLVSECKFDSGFSEMISSMHIWTVWNKVKGFANTIHNLIYGHASFSNFCLWKIAFAKCFIQFLSNFKESWPTSPFDPVYSFEFIIVNLFNQTVCVDRVYFDSTKPMPCINAVRRQYAAIFVPSSYTYVAVLSFENY